MSNDSRDYYCSMKFKFLKIDLESNTTYNCHAASPHAVDFSFLDKNPGQLFNIPINVVERQQMLNNQRNSSCEQNCWAAEDRNAISPRLYQGGTKRTHTKVVTTPEIIDLTIGGDCNLTCSYCCKEFSNAWRRDIIKNGDYVITGATDDRFIGNSKDRLLVNQKQSELKQSSNYKKLLGEIEKSLPDLKELVVTGGEPLLDNYLIETLSNFNIPETTEVSIYTGLGISSTRFEKMLERLKSIPKLKLIISAETTHEFLEFNRYGIKWDEFVHKVEMIKQHQIDYVFQATLSNLTLFGFSKFYKTFGNERTIVTFAYQPRMMAPNVLDEDSKRQLEEEFKSLPEIVREKIFKSMQAPATEQDRINLREFLQQFVQRRADLNLNIYPEKFLKWLEIDNVV